MTLPILRLHGTAYEQGRRHGRLLRRHIAHNLNLYFLRFLEEGRLPRPAVIRRARSLTQLIHDVSPAYHAGMQGLADGSGYHLDEIAALNVRYELLYPQFSGGTEAIRPAMSQARPAAATSLRPWVDGCTALAVPPTRSAAGRLLIGQNWDWFPEVKGALLHTQEPDGAQRLTFTEAGIFGGKIGLNSAGLGLVINGLTSPHDDATPSIPFHVRTYEILRQTSFAAALAVAAQPGQACSANFLLAQAPNHIVNVEVAPHDYLALPAGDECLVHTNHFLQPEAIGIVEQEERISSNQRWQRLSELVRDRPAVTLQDVQTWLSDHAGHPNGVCQHVDANEPAHEQYVTVTSIILDLSRRLMFITDGAPCQRPYHRLALS